MSARRAAVAAYLILISQVAWVIAFDHQSHAVPGKSKTVFENPPDSGGAVVPLDGSSSHSHYFSEGPPVRTGRIVSFLWKELKSGRVLGRKEKISARLFTGETTILLTVKDQTGDTSSATTNVTVLPADRVLRGVMLYFYDTPTTKASAFSYPRPFFSTWRQNVAIWNKNGLPPEFRGVTEGAIRAVTRFYPRRTGHYKFEFTFMGGDCKVWVNGILIAEETLNKEGQEKKILVQHGTKEGKLLNIEILLIRKFFPTRLVFSNSAVATSSLPATPLDVTNSLRLSFQPKTVVPLALYGSHSKSNLEGGQHFYLRASGLDGAGDFSVKFACGSTSRDLVLDFVDAETHTIYGVIPAFPKACIGTVSIHTKRKGKSNVLPFEFTDNSMLVPQGLGKSSVESLKPVKFQSTILKAKGGKPFKIPAPTSIALGPDGRFYVGTLTGIIHVLTVDTNLRVTASCKSARVVPKGSILGLAFNPLEKYGERSATVYMSVSVLYHRTKKTGAAWDNGKILAWKSVPDERCIIFDREVISGLPVSDRDHGVNSITFDLNNRLYISVGSITNGGLRSPKFGNMPEGHLSAAVLVADLSKPKFNGKIKYSSKDIGKAKKISGNVDLYSTGVRNSFGLMFHSQHGLYATDNGLNQGFGDISTTCSKSVVARKTAPDKLLRLKKGGYYGFPNRLRKECTYEELSGSLLTLESSTPAIAEYTSNAFGGRLRGQVFLGKFAGRSAGMTTRVVLSADGAKVAGGPTTVAKMSGVGMVVGGRGSILMPQVQQGVVRALRPVGGGDGIDGVLGVVPRAGRRSGRNVVAVYGAGAGKGKVYFGDKECEKVANMDGGIRCVVPAGRKRGGVRVQVGKPNKGSETAGGDYFYA